MTLTTRILEFMDGTLPADEEAELLHILSVSPERRELLRSFMNQKALFSRDRRSIQVPYAAEQGLWERLAPVMPPVAATVEQAAMSSASSSAMSSASGSAMSSVVAETVTKPIAQPFFSRIMTVASAAVGTATLMVGLGVGYLAGMGHSTTTKTFIQTERSGASNVASTATSQNTAAASNALYASASPSRDMPRASAVSPVGLRSSASSATANQIPLFIDRTVSADPSSLGLSSESAGAGVEAGEPTSMSRVSARPLAAISLDRVGGEGVGIRPMLLHSASADAEQKTFLQRFEFLFSESFGRQFPNSLATNTALPLVTNSSIGAYFQVLPRSNALWIGGAFGTANVTRKDLFTRVGTKLDPLQEVIMSDTAHTQTSYASAFLQYRMPIFSGMMLTLTGGYGWASLGQLVSGELGFHYDVSREVGIQMGLRAVRFSYDLTQEKNDVIRSGSTSLVVPNGIADASPTLSMELNTGLFFHF